jgi:hypothetical protein
MTRWPQAVSWAIGYRWTWIGHIYGDGGTREQDDRYLLLPGPRSSNRSCSLALASLPSEALETPDSLLLETST